VNCGLPFCSAVSLGLPAKAFGELGGFASDARHSLTGKTMWRAGEASLTALRGGKPPSTTQYLDTTKREVLTIFRLSYLSDASRPAVHKTLQFKQSNRQGTRLGSDFALEVARGVPPVKITRKMRVPRHLFLWT
jgi:hypothetical protein